jgi:hypothetical protein
MEEVEVCFAKMGPRGTKTVGALITGEIARQARSSRECGGGLAQFRKLLTTKQAVMRWGVSSFDAKRGE